MVFRETVIWILCVLTSVVGSALVFLMMQRQRDARVHRLERHELDRQLREARRAAMASDPGEERDLSAREAERRAAMTLQLEATLRTLRSLQKERGSSAREISRDTLEDLGYAGDD